MKRFPFFFSLAGLCFFAACGPADQQQTQTRQQDALPADSLPADGTAVTPDTAPEDLAAGAVSPADPASYRISPGQAGPIRIGMQVSELKEKLPGQLKETVLHLEGQPYKAFQIGQFESGVLVEEKCRPDCQVWRIQVRDAAYRTGEGLGVGSSLGEVKKHYPISFLGPGETEIVAISKQKKITFLLDVSGLPEKKVPFLNLQNTPDSVKVLGMLIL
ncbi:MAG: mechanosensitive ion channel protein MscS [Adhaeribacter sp.]